MKNLCFLIFFLSLLACKNPNHINAEHPVNHDLDSNSAKLEDMNEYKYITSVRKDNQWYFINERNEILFDKVFTYASYFSNDLVCVSMDGIRVDGQDKVYGAYYSAMDSDGDFVENIKSDLPFVFRENRAIISYGPRKMLIDKNGNILKEASLLSLIHI